MKSALTFATVVSALALAAGAHADVLFDNIGAASSGSDAVASFGPLADSFSTGATAYNSVSVSVLIAGDPSGVGTTNVYLMSDSNTAPGTILAAGSIPDSSTSAAFTPVTLSGPVSLAAGTRYWLELSSADSSAQWSWSFDSSGAGVAGEYFSNANGVFSNADGPYQMEIVTSGGGVPEPATWAMMTLGLGSLGAVLRRRAARTAAV